MKHSSLVHALRACTLCAGIGLALSGPPAALAQIAATPLSEKIKATRTLVVGIESTYPPMAYKDPQSNKRIGVNVELVEIIAKELGVSVQWEEMSFEQLSPSLATGRIHMIGTAFTDLPSRREKLTFVDYLATGAQPFTTSGKKDSLKAAGDLCGKTVGVPRTTSYYPVTIAWSDKNCVGAGKAASTVNGTAGATATRLDLKQGRLDAAVLGPEYVSYLMNEEPGVYALVGEPLNKTLFGFAFDKNEPALRDAVATAVTAAIKNGSYKQVLQKYGIGRQALADVTVDAGK